MPTPASTRPCTSCRSRPTARSNRRQGLPGAGRLGPRPDLQRRRHRQERGIVLEELRLGKGAGDRMNKVLLPKMFNGSRYAERLPIGRKNAPHLQARRHQALLPRLVPADLMAVVVVGDIDPLEGRAPDQAHFGKLKNPGEEPRPREYARFRTRARHRSGGRHRQGSQCQLALIRYPVQPRPPAPPFATTARSWSRTCSAGC
jgi:zinc protease